MELSAGLYASFGDAVGRGCLGARLRRSARSRSSCCFRLANSAAGTDRTARVSRWKRAQVVSDSLLIAADPFRIAGFKLICFGPETRTQDREQNPAKQKRERHQPHECERRHRLGIESV